MASIAGPWELPSGIVRELRALVGQSCTLHRIRTDRSLSIGFGSIDGSGRSPHGEWEIGTYRGSWRVVRNGVILCGSRDAVDSINDLNDCLTRTGIGEFLSIEHLSRLDFRVNFSSDVSIDIFCTFSDDDEVLHIFFPGKKVAAFSAQTGWMMGPSDQPWNPAPPCMD